MRALRSRGDPARHGRAVAAAIVLMVNAACGRNPARAAGSDAIRERPDVITRSEVMNTQATNAYDAVRLLRPAFMRTRGPTSLTRQQTDVPVVYLDDRRLGDPSYLRDIPIQLIFEIRYLSASEAQQRWGSGHPAGVILVISAKTM